MRTYQSPPSMDGEVTRADTTRISSAVYLRDHCAKVLVIRLGVLLRYGRSNGRASGLANSVGH